MMGVIVYFPGLEGLFCCGRVGFGDGFLGGVFLSVVCLFYFNICFLGFSFTLFCSLRVGFVGSSWGGSGVLM